MPIATFILVVQVCPTPHTSDFHSPWAAQISNFCQIAPAQSGGYIALRSAGFALYTADRRRAALRLIVPLMRIGEVRHDMATT